MARGRPKGSKNKSTISQLKAERRALKVDTPIDTSDMSDDEIISAKKQKIYKKCVQKALDSHDVNFSEGSEKVIRGVTSILFKELEDAFNIKLKQIRSRND